jgi:hypothetical protein
VEPGQNVTCIIYVRDALQEPTSIFSLSDFVVQPVVAFPGVSVMVSPFTVGIDPTTIVFTLSTNGGSNVGINVYATASGNAVRYSGLVVTAMAWPALYLGPMVCAINGSALALRSSTICNASATGSQGLPAVVHPADVFFTEDHFAGSFAFISGQEQLVFQFTASNTITSPFNNFTLRVTLRQTNAVFSTSFPMTYPSLPPNGNTILQCNSLSSAMCYISASDNIGPVLFQPSRMVVVFERLDKLSNAWLPSTQLFNVSLTPGPSGDMAVLSWQLVVNNAVTQERVHLYVIQADGTTVEARGSPFAFTSGIAPNAAAVVLQGCQATFIAQGNSTICTMLLRNGVSGDPSYYTLQSSLGATFSNLQYFISPSTGQPMMQFAYTAPSLSSTSPQDDYVSVVIASRSSLGSPFKITVYSASAQVVVYDFTGSIPGLIALGLSWYGLFIGLGVWMFVQRRRRMYRVKLLKAELEEAAEERAAAPSHAAHSVHFEEAEPPSSHRTHAPRAEEEICTYSFPKSVIASRDSPPIASEDREGPDTATPDADDAPSETLPLTLLETRSGPDDDSPE